MRSTYEVSVAAQAVGCCSFCLLSTLKILFFKFILNFFDFQNTRRSN